ncbi:MAG: InlB B-repeat-containing protein, partial [Oscillospiraceae bacterium]|nr:InlB B-repeat-containing protein [Oscillospiraceae bacterium]
VSRVGYTFLHWSLSENGTAVPASALIDTDTILYARWEPDEEADPDPTYTVSFIGNGGTPAIQTRTVDADTNFGTAIGLAAPVSRVGYTFLYWSLSESGTAVPASALIDADTILYARWEPEAEAEPDPTYTVTFIGNGGTPAIQTQTVEEDTNFGTAIGQITPVSRSGYTFLYWSLSENGTAVPASALIEADTILYARWEPDGNPDVIFRVSFVGNGGIRALQEEFVDNDMTTIGAIIALVSEPIRSGYTFLYWSLEEDGSEVDENAIVDGNTVLYAQWLLDDEPPDELTVTFIGNGGTPATQTAVIAPDASYAEAISQITEPRREGYIFQGWFTASENGSQVIETDSVAATGYFQLYARWKPDPDAPLISEHHSYLFGFSDGTIQPEQNITRAEVATIFFRLITDEFRGEVWSKSNTYSDVQADNWFNNAVSTMSNAGVFTGMSDGTFAPNKPITRGEFAAVAARLIRSEVSLAGDAALFSDTSGHWAEEYINLIFEYEWAEGFGDGTFRPDDLLTRAQVAAIINRMTGRNIEHRDDLLDGMCTWPDNASQESWYYLHMQAATNAADYVQKEGGNYIKWTTVWQPLDFTILERTDAEHHHIVSAREAWRIQKESGNNIGS